MRKLVLQMGVTLDLIVSGPRAVGAPEDPEALQWIADHLRDVSTHIMGRVTYLEMAGHWPTSTDKMFADPMNNIPKVVFSRSLEKADWPQTRIARGDLTDEINALKAESSGEIMVHGGYRFVQELSRRRLVDEYRLMVKPGVAGVGEPLFKDLPEVINLELVAAKPFPSGALAVIYRPRA